MISKRKYYERFLGAPAGYTVIEPPAGTPYDSINVDINPTENTFTIKVWIDEDFFYITSPHSASGIATVGNSVLWWGKERCGYTTNLDEAGRYSRSEAESIVKNKRGDKMFPCAPIDEMVRREVHIDSLRKYELEYACAVGTGYMKDFLNEHAIAKVRQADKGGDSED